MEKNDVNKQAEVEKMVAEMHEFNMFIEAFNRQFNRTTKYDFDELMGNSNSKKPSKAKFLDINEIDLSDPMDR